MRRILYRSFAMLALFPVVAHAGEMKAIFIPHWQPQAQFAGYYTALEKGFYAARGIELTIMRGGPGRPAEKLLAEGKADFATMFLSTAIEERDKGAPLINIAQIGQRSALLLVARKSSGIRSPADFDGRRISIWPEFMTQPTALFRKYGVHPQVIPQGSTPNLFLRGGVDACSAMWYNEYHLLLNAGLDPDELVVIHCADHAINFPEDGIYCLEQTLRANPEMCRRFVLASIEGWRYAFENPGEALDIMMKHVREAGLPVPRIHNQWMLNSMKDIILPEGLTKIGPLSEEAFLSVARELKEEGIIETIPEYSSFHENCGE